MSKERIIRKITVQSGGLKGLILEGSVESIKDNKIVTNDFKDTIRHPIHRELEDMIGDLRFFALDICGLIIDETPKLRKQNLLENCEVVSLEFEKGVHGYFKIKVNNRVFDTKQTTFTTPKTDLSDGCVWFERVTSIIESLLIEIDQYVKGIKKITDEDLMISFIKHGKVKNLDIESLEAMTPKDRADWLQNKLESMGCVVIRPDEIYDDAEIEEIDVEEENKNVLALDLGSDNDMDVNLDEIITVS